MMTVMKVMRPGVMASQIMIADHDDRLWFALLKKDRISILWNPDDYEHYIWWVGSDRSCWSCRLSDRCDI